MFAYLTFLSNRNYLDGVLTLYKSLHLVKSQYPLYCLLSMNVETDVINVLRTNGIECIQLKECVTSDQSVNSLQWALNWNYTFDKLYMWGLTQFKKIVFIDADMIVTANIDHLFEKKAFSAALAGVLFPTGKDIKILNSGLMVVEPSSEILERLLKIAKELIPEMKRKGLPVGDQDIINAYVPDWFEHKDLILDDAYNLYAHYLQCYMRHHNYSFNPGTGKQIHIIHYVGMQKPWHIVTVKQFVKMCMMSWPNLYYILAYFKFKKIQRQVVVNNNC